MRRHVLLKENDTADLFVILDSVEYLPRSDDVLLLLDGFFEGELVLRMYDVFNEGREHRFPDVFVMGGEVAAERFLHHVQNRFGHKGAG